MADRYLWTPADGSPPIDLTDEAAGYSVEADGTRGLRSATYRFAATPRADGDGETVTAVKADPNRPSVGMLVRGATPAEFEARCRHLVRSMRPKAGPGTLTVTGDHAGPRSLSCYVEGGLEGDQSDDTELPGRWWRFVLKLYAPVPWWRGVSVPEEWSLERPPARNWFPLIGNHPTASVVGGRRELVVPGDEAVRPPWVIQGPGSGLLIRNHTAGWEVVVDHDIPSSGPASRITVTTETGEQSIRDGYGNSLFGRITNGPDGGWEMGPLLPGVNDVEVRIDGSGADSSVSLTYAPLYGGL